MNKSTQGLHLIQNNKGINEWIKKGRGKFLKKFFSLSLDGAYQQPEFSKSSWNIEWLQAETFVKETGAFGYSWVSQIFYAFYCKNNASFFFFLI